MMRLRMLISMGCLLALAGAAAAQTPAPVPAPAPPARPVAPAAPVAPIPPAAPFDDQDLMMGPGPDGCCFGPFATLSQDAQQRLMSLKDNLSKLQVKSGDLLAQSSAGTAAQQETVRRAREREAMAAQQDALSRAQGVFAGRLAAASLYYRGQSALDARRWDEALSCFTEAVAKGGDRAEGALYWKAYALNKLGRRDDALAAIAELRKSYSASRWLDDAKALELEVKQANGQPVSPESQTDEDLKLMALNGLMDSDPERAIPAVENLLKGAQPPRLKERALYVLAQSNSPKAQQIVEQVARGGAGNPDLQMKAIDYLGAAGRQGMGIYTGVAAYLGAAMRPGTDGQAHPQHGQLLSEIYNSSSDINVKRAVLDSLSASRDSDRLLQIARTEKTPELRLHAVRRLSLLRLSNSDALVAIYGADQDKNVKRAIVDGFASQSNVKAMVAAARTERDPEMVRYVVGRLASMKSPEAADYLMEILKK